MVGKAMVVVVVGAAYNHMNNLNHNYNIYNVTMITCQGNDTFHCQSDIVINTVVLAASSLSETGCSTPARWSWLGSSWRACFFAKTC